MALQSNTAESGLASGTGVTNGNSDDGTAGDAFATSIPGVSGLSTVIFSTAQKAHGSMSYLFTTKPSDTSYVQWTLTGSHSSTAIRFYFYTTTTPSTTAIIAQVRNGSQAAQIALGSDLRLRVQNAISTDLTGASGANWGSISTNTWYRIEMIVTKGTTTSNGRIQAAVFLLDNTTAISGMTLDNNATNTGTIDFTQVRFGRAGGAATSADQVYYMDDFAAQDTSSYLGPAGANIKPVVVPSATNVYVIKGNSGTFGWTDSDADGTIASRTVTHVSGPDNPSLSSPTATTRSATYTTQGTHAYEVYATDDDGADSDVQTIYVHVTDTMSRPTSVVANSGPWTNQGGAGSIQAALADASDATFARTPENPAGSALTLGNAPLGVGPVRVTTRGRQSGVGLTVTRTVELMEGATIIATRTVVLTSSWADHTWTTTSSETSAIVERKNLYVRITDTAA
jgi:hypothetical protein